MADMRRYFDDERINLTNHWLLPKNDENMELTDSFDSNLDFLDPVKMKADSNYREKMMDFEKTVSEKFKEEIKEEEIMYIRKWTNTGLHIVTLITEHLISHPFIVLRRQCQVNNKLFRYHIIPITLIPIVVNIHQWQGITCLWKGVGSVLIIKGLTLAVQDLLSKITLWPKEITVDSSSKYIGKHILLKFVTCAIITPFYSASLLETVQSEIASEKPELLDVFKEGLRRLISFGLPQKGRMLPVWSLIVPTATYIILKHLFALYMKRIIFKTLILNQDFQHRRRGAIPKDFEFRDNQNIELSSSLVAVLTADIVLYPLETILHRLPSINFLFVFMCVLYSLIVSLRLHLQGTRTIIDNLDNGSSVRPILTNFEGVTDCYETTIRDEGVSGLYKGFGAISLLFYKNDNYTLGNASSDKFVRRSDTITKHYTKPTEIPSNYDSLSDEINFGHNKNK